MSSEDHDTPEEDEELDSQDEDVEMESLLGITASSELPRARLPTTLSLPRRQGRQQRGKTRFAIPCAAWPRLHQLLLAVALLFSTLIVVIASSAPVAVVREQPLPQPTTTPPPPSVASSTLPPVPMCISPYGTTVQWARYQNQDVTDVVVHAIAQVVAEGKTTLAIDGDDFATLFSKVHNDAFPGILSIQYITPSCDHFVRTWDSAATVELPVGKQAPSSCAWSPCAQHCTPGAALSDTTQCVTRGVYANTLWWRRATCNGCVLGGRWTRVGHLTLGPGSPPHPLYGNDTQHILDLLSGHDAIITSPQGYTDLRSTLGDFSQLRLTCGRVGQGSAMDIVIPNKADVDFLLQDSSLNAGSRYGLIVDVHQNGQQRNIYFQRRQSRPGMVNLVDTYLSPYYWNIAYGTPQCANMYSNSYGLQWSVYIR